MSQVPEKHIVLRDVQIKHEEGSKRYQRTLKVVCMMNDKICRM